MSKWFFFLKVAKNFIALRNVKVQKKVAFGIV